MRSLTDIIDRMQKPSADSAGISRVHAHSTDKPVPFERCPKEQAVRLWYRARDFNQRTRRPRCHGGAIGHVALHVMHALIFDCLNYTTGQLDPSYATIARKAKVSERSVANALVRLRTLGILTWTRRSESQWENGRLIRRQRTNAYTLRPFSEWNGYGSATEIPPPEAGTWGEASRMLSVLEQASSEIATCGGLQDIVRILANGPPNGLEQALASLGRSIDARGD